MVKTQAENSEASSSFRKKQLQKELKELKSGISETRLFMVTLLVCFLATHLWLYNRPSSSPSSSEDTGALIETIAKLQEKLKEARTRPVTPEITEIIGMFSFPYIMERAQKSKPEVHFASNKTRGRLVASVAASITSFDIYTCNQIDLPAKFDAYRNCFRDLAIEFHNRLSLKIEDSHWFTAVGRVQYSFLITTMQSKRHEYLISVGDIVFQALEYPVLVTSTPESIKIDEDNSNEEIEMEKVKEVLSKMNVTKVVASED